MNNKSRTVIAVTCGVLLAAVAIGYVLNAREDVPPDGVRAAATGMGGPALQVLDNGVLATVSLRDPLGPRVATSRKCDRAYAAADTIACLTPVDALVATRLVLLDADLGEQRSIPLTGFPNRLRVSASGRMVAWTLFIDGHSYATGGFSTRTGILDTRTGTVVDSLEDFAATVGGKPYQAVDVNFWGVTFTGDDNRFYATMSTGGHRYLVEGDFAAKTVTALTDNVECPSLSPDGTRIAFKAAIGADPSRGWRLSVLDPATGAIVPLAETRSVDDQAMWIDNATVAYALQRDDGINDVWTVPADGTGQPRLLVSEANSPSVRP